MYNYNSRVICPQNTLAYGTERPIYIRSRHLFRHYDSFTARCLLPDFLPRLSVKFIYPFRMAVVVQWAIIAVIQYSRADCPRLGYYSTNAYDKMEIWGPGCPNSVIHKGISGSPEKWTIANG